LPGAVKTHILTGDAAAAAAEQVGDVARLAAEEVARLQGQLADLDRKNRLQVSCGDCLLMTDTICAIQVRAATAAAAAWMPDFGRMKLGNKLLL
jgi:uncharacterized membrane protein YgcG